MHKKRDQSTKLFVFIDILRNHFTHLNLRDPIYFVSADKEQVENLFRSVSRSLELSDDFCSVRRGGQSEGSGIWLIRKEYVPGVSIMHHIAPALHAVHGLTKTKDFATTEKEERHLATGEIMELRVTLDDSKKED